MKDRLAVRALISAIDDDYKSGSPALRYSVGTGPPY